MLWQTKWVFGLSMNYVILVGLDRGQKLPILHSKKMTKGQFLLRFWNVLVLVLVLTFASIFID